MIKTILPANEIFMKFFSTLPNAGERRCSSVISVNNEDGLLLWNTLTQELLLMEGKTQEYWEQENFSIEERNELCRSWMLVPKVYDEQTVAEQLRTLLKAMLKETNSRTFTIFTTLNCNARCPYCFERDMQKMPMSEEVALDVAKFILKESKGDKVYISWFGGEPLLGVKRIDLISQKLREEGVQFSSDMITNGLLFDEDNILRAVDLWNLKKVQITLDGTEEKYNRIKGFPKTKFSPYKRVLENIELLAKHGIKVSIRLNLSLDNAEDLMLLAEELGSRFAGKSNITVYSRQLFEYDKTKETETIKSIFEKYRTLIQKLQEEKVYAESKLPLTLKVNHCMADQDNSFGILPDGRIDKCRDECAMETVGDIWNGITDIEKNKWFKQRVPEEEKCKTCVFAPSCTLLSACSVKCNELYRLKKRFDLEQSMLAAYRKWKEENNRKENETEE